MDDPRSWETIYAEHRVELLRYVHRLTRDVHLAEDVVQDAFLRLWRETRTVENPRSWLYRVCTNMVRDHARRTATRERHTPVADDAVSPSPEEDVERAESVRLVRLALERILPRDREALLLRESGFRYAEIADVIDVRCEIVPTLIARALKRFHKAYLQETTDVAP
ncbi:MAG: sigma-70 family RNA polymerase sigma factor [Gemmatimonadota bacterium]